MKFNLRQIEMFRAIMVTGSVSGAARLLNVSQPAISRLLAYTEDRLKMRLFERMQGRILPTPEARRLFAEVEDVHRGVLRINDLTEELQRRGTGTLHIVASPSIAQTILPDAIGRFRKSFPDVFLEMEILTLRELVDRVGAHRVDIGFSGIPVDDPRIAQESLAEGRLSLICRRDHPLALLKAVDLTALTEYSIIGYHSQTPYGELVAKAIANCGARIHFDAVVRFTPVACGLVQAGVGLAIADDFVVCGASSFPDLITRPLTPIHPMRLYALHSRSEPSSRLGRAISDAVSASAKRLRPPDL